MGGYRKALLWGLVWAAATRGSSAELEQDLVHTAAGTAGVGVVSGGSAERTSSGKRLHGRFLHITDFHPDPHYKTYSSTEEDAACHRKRGPAGYYGAETSACDSPLSLVNATMEWVKDNIADEIDFVIWTGDSARHDNDEKLPRTQKQIIDQNKFMVQKFTELFGTNGRSGELFKIPIVPTFGNNDIMPHNILLAGPNKWTVRYQNLWRGMIPEAQKHQFQQGGWFSVEVIKNKLAVISLNTMYFFTSNTGVDGCANKHEPGYDQFEWLRIQLQIMRDRGVSAILIGHVPPARVKSKASWEESCWQKFALWEQQYRDVITASFFGHMNIDHFMLEDFKQISKSAKNGKMATSQGVKKNDAEIGLLQGGEVTVASATDYLLDLRKRWAKLPKPSKKAGKSSLDEDNEDEFDEDEHSIWASFLNMFSKSKKGNKPDKKPKKTYLEKIGGKYAERYSVSFVSPSVVPNYFPTLRIIEYNISGLEDALVAPVQVSPENPRLPSEQSPLFGFDLYDDDAYLQGVEMAVKRKQKQKDKEALKKKKKYKFKVPEGPSKSAPPGPAYSPQPLTMTGYTQYFANLTYINNDFVEDASSFTLNSDSPRTIFGLDVGEDGEIENSGWKEGKHRKHQGKKPRPTPHPNKFKYEIEYDTKTDKRYKLKDMTVRRWLELARRIAQKGGPKASDVFGETEEDDIDDAECSEEQDSDCDEEFEELKGKQGKKGKKDKKNKKHGKNLSWYTFVRRAFVSTMDSKEIEEVFGASDEAEHVEEVMEL